VTPEIYWMTLTVFMTALYWLPYVLDRMAVRGLLPAFAGTIPEAGAHSVWAQRAIRAHQNAVENLVVFVPAVLTAHALGISTPATQAAAAVYFFARLTHFFVYMAGVPFARTLAFTAGWLAQIVILASILRWI
jgi:uncharacterized MAPEG superfamily protein